jgi:hypothetical protein
MDLLCAAHSEMSSTLAKSFTLMRLSSVEQLLSCGTRSRLFVTYFSTLLYLYTQTCRSSCGLPGRFVAGQFLRRTCTRVRRRNCLTKHSTLNLPHLPNNKSARTLTRDDKKHRPRVSRRSDTKHSALNKHTVVL